MVTLSIFLDTTANFVNNSYAFVTTYVTWLHIDFRMSTITVQFTNIDQVSKFDTGTWRGCFTSRTMLLR